MQKATYGCLKVRLILWLPVNCWLFDKNGTVSRRLGSLVTIGPSLSSPLMSSPAMLALPTASSAQSAAGWRQSATVADVTAGDIFQLTWWSEPPTYSGSVAERCANATGRRRRKCTQQALTAQRLCCQRKHVFFLRKHRTRIWFLNMFKISKHHAFYNANIFLQVAQLSLTKPTRTTLHHGKLPNFKPVTWPQPRPFRGL